jgi:hypothetical protein
MDSVCLLYLRLQQQIHFSGKVLTPKIRLRIVPGKSGDDGSVLELDPAKGNPQQYAAVLLVLNVCAPLARGPGQP